MTNPVMQSRETRSRPQLDSLEIHNFRAFRHLEIEKLGKVNLIVGKNSVGKSALLEAIRLYAAQGAPGVIGDLLQDRDEWSPRQSRPREANDTLIPVDNLFYGRQSLVQNNSVIRIGPAGLRSKTLTLEVGWVALKTDSDGERTWIRVASPIGVELNSIDDSDTIEPRLVIQYNSDRSQLLRLNSNWLSQSARPILDAATRSAKPVFIATAGLSIEEIVVRWEQISLLPEIKGSVIGALQIIVPEVENLDIIGHRQLAGESLSRYTPVVMAKLADVQQPVPMRSLGEGMIRVFGMALALVTAQDTVLLIDEIDRGLHHSVQIEVWRLIFALAETLNVQVFATTHSWDCVAAFQHVADEDAQQDSILIRLQREGDDVVPVLIDEATLAIVTREQIEIR